MKPPKAKEIKSPLESAIVSSYLNLQLGEPGKKVNKIISKTADKLAKDISHQLKSEYKHKLKADKKEQKKTKKKGGDVTSEVLVIKKKIK